MEQQDKIINDYFAQLPTNQIDPQFAKRLVELGNRTLNEREVVRADRQSVWIAAMSAVLLFGVAFAILQLTGVDIAGMLSSITVSTYVMDSQTWSSILSWSILGTIALAMLIIYTILISRHTAQHNEQ